MPFVAQENPKVSREKVVAICEALGSEHATLRAVHDQIGGSMRDVARFVKEWRETQPKPTLVVPETTELAAQISARLVAADVGQSSVRLERWWQEQKAQSAHWRDEIDALRDAIDGLRRQSPNASADRPTSNNVVPLGERAAAPPELNKALTDLHTRLQQLDRELKERDAKFPGALESALTAVTRNAEASAERIVQVLSDLPQTLRQAPVSQVDASINRRLEATTLELTHRAAELAARPDRTDAVIAALDRLNAAAARRQTKQVRQATTAHDALLVRVDALVKSLTARRRRRKTAKETKPARRTRAARPRPPPPKRTQGSVTRRKGAAVRVRKPIRPAATKSAIRKSPAASRKTFHKRKPRKSK